MHWNTRATKKKESWDVFVPVSVYLYCRDTYEKAHSCIWVYIAYTQRGILYVSIDEKSSLWPHPAHVSTPEPGVLLVPQWQLEITLPTHNILCSVQQYAHIQLKFDLIPFLGPEKTCYRCCYLWECTSVRLLQDSADTTQSSVISKHCCETRGSGGFSGLSLCATFCIYGLVELCSH